MVSSRFFLTYVYRITGQGHRVSFHNSFNFHFMRNSKKITTDITTIIFFFTTAQPLKYFFVREVLFEFFFIIEICSAEWKFIIITFFLYFIRGGKNLNGTSTNYSYIVVNLCTYLFLFFCLIFLSFTLIITYFVFQHYLSSFFFVLLCLIDQTSFYFYFHYYFSATILIS